MPEPTEFPIALQTFAKSLVGTEDEVWILVLKNQFGRLKLTEAGWREKLQSLKS